MWTVSSEDLLANSTKIIGDVDRYHVCLSVVVAYGQSEVCDQYHRLDEVFGIHISGRPLVLHIRETSAFGVRSQFKMFSKQ